MSSALFAGFATLPFYVADDLAMTFSALDQSNDGKLDRPEVLNALAKIAPGQAPSNLEKVAEALIVSADANNDGLINFGEFIDFLERRKRDILATVEVLRHHATVVEDQSTEKISPSSLAVLYALYSGRQDLPEKTIPSTVAAVTAELEGYFFDLPAAVIADAYNALDRFAPRVANGEISLNPFIAVFAMAKTSNRRRSSKLAMTTPLIEEFTDHAVSSRSPAAPEIVAPAEKPVVSAAFLGFMAALPFSVADEIAMTFSNMDESKDGKLDRTEVRAALTKILPSKDEPVVDKVTDALIAAADANGDGMIDFGEFIAFLECRKKDILATAQHLRHHATLMGDKTVDKIAPSSLATLYALYSGRQDPPVTLLPATKAAITELADGYFIDLPATALEDTVEALQQFAPRSAEGEISLASFICTFAKAKPNSRRKTSKLMSPSVVDEQDADPLAILSPAQVNALCAALVTAPGAVGGELLSTTANFDSLKPFFDPKLLPTNTLLDVAQTVTAQPTTLGDFLAALNRRSSMPLVQQPRPKAVPRPVYTSQQLGPI